MAATAVFVLTSSAGFARETRGAWVTAWTSGFFTRQQVESTVAAAKNAGLNALFIQVRKNADAYYKSDTEPLGSGVSPGFDPLACMIEKAHAEGIEVHAWVNSCRIWTAKDLPKDPKHIANRHIEWLNKDVNGGTRANEGLYLDPGIPEVRDYIASVAQEIVRKYDIDGINLDYIRYPGKEWGYSDLALEQYNGAPSGSRPDPSDAKWLQWRRDQVTALVRLVRNKVGAVKPNIAISACTVPWGDCPANWANASPYAIVCQDWKLWAADGLVDANMPMNYKSEGSAKQAQQFRNWLQGFNRWSGGRPVYVGIDANTNQASEIARQVAAVRKAGLDGWALFSFNESARRDALAAALAVGPCRAWEFASSQEALNRGVQQASAGQIGLAKRCLTISMEMDPSNVEAYFRLGRCYLKEQNYSDAKQFFERALSLDPSHADAKAELKALAKYEGTRNGQPKGSDEVTPK